MKRENLKTLPALSAERSAMATVPGEPRPAAVFGRAARIHRALGDEERIRICALLVRGPCSVGEVALQTRSALPTVSQRLKALLAAGVVGRRRAGRNVLYSLADDHVAELVRNTLAHAGEGYRRR